MTTTQSGLYEEIDLRPYIEALLKQWVWLIVIPAVAGVITFVLLSTFPAQYQSTALVAITKPRFSMQFDPRFETIEDQGIGYGAYEEVANSDALVAQLFSELSTKPEGVESFREFRDSVLSTQVGENLTLLQLNVTTTDPELSTEIANRWAALVIQRSNELYGNLGNESVDFLEIQLADLETDLEATENALIEFQATNSERILQNELNDLVSRQQRHLTTQANIDNLILDVNAFRDLLSTSSSTALSQADQLTALSLQAQAFNALVTNLQLDLGGDFSLTATGRAELIANLDSLVETLGVRRDEINELLGELEPQILAKQRDLQGVQIESTDLLNDLENLRDTRDLLHSSVEEAKISSQDVGSQVKLAASAIMPDEPLPSGRLMRSVLVALAVGIGVCFIVLINRWWYSLKTESRVNN